MKTCTVCDNTKPLLEFSKNKSAKDGLHYYCKICDAAKIKHYKQRNPEKVALANKQYKQQNRDKVNAKKARRRARKLQATPPWLNKDHFDEIRLYYTEAVALRLYTGEEYHVDHILPLQGRVVCGLHVPWNLQVIAKKDNLRKSNNLILEPEMVW